MRKSLPYIILFLMVVLLGSLLIVSSKKKVRRLDERITLRVKDKIPYGTYAAFHFLPHLFPQAKVYYDRKSPGNWDSLSSEASNQAVILMTKEFDAEDYELNRLYNFVKEGNYVFIIARYLSYDATKFFSCSDNGNYFDLESADSLLVNLEQPPFKNSDFFVYPGKKYESHFSNTDTARTLNLGKGNNGGVNFIRLKAGRGALFIHLAPLAFSNYFLLHKNNVDYYKTALSVIPPNISRIAWNDYYLTKPRVNKEKDPSWFRVLFKYPSFKWGLLTAMATLLVFVLLETRRKQRIIPAWERPNNESLDFVKTIGRLYFDKSDHKNLAKKMSTYFLDHIRTNYKLATHSVDKNFIDTVHHKTGYSIEELKKIVDFISFAETAPAISESQLSHFHKQLELFYQNT